MKLLWCVVILTAISYVHQTSGYGVNGGIECAACTIVTGILSQVAQIHHTEVINVTLHLCDHVFSRTAENICKDTVRSLEPLLHLLIELKEVTPDTFCYGLNICHQDPGERRCHLFPAPAFEKFNADIKVVQDKGRRFLRRWHRLSSSNRHSICDLPGVRAFCDYLLKVFKGMQPGFDFDGDNFSPSEKWRGSHWRGRDCSDFSSKVYPGRLPYNADVNYDANCNGIWGLDQSTGIPWETKLCASSKSRGIVMLGDSVGAHFHFPLVWFDPEQISQETFLRNSTSAVLDELDWPQYSFSTGFKNITDPQLIQGHVDSIYLRMRRRNLCNHRDYQNICRNGATSFDLVNNVKNIARSHEDKPVTVLIGVFGNDVCNRFPDTLKNMTSTKQFYKNMKAVIQTLESTLPNNSHVSLIGLINGSFIYDTLANRLHPIGTYNGNVKYIDVFRWFECMQISPCNGWLSEEKFKRIETTKRALELTHVMKYLATSYKSKKLSLSFVPNPLPEVIKIWSSRGGEVWQLFESVDGFHPNQIAQPIITEVLWRSLKQFAPESLGLVNIHNREILKQFGDQGGH